MIRIRKVLSPASAPLTIDHRKKPSRQSLQASSTRRPTSSRVDTNRRSAGLIGVEIRCLALISAISASSGNRVRRSCMTGLPRELRPPPRCRASPAIAKSHSIALDCGPEITVAVLPAGGRTHRLRPVAPDGAADLPDEQGGETDQEQRARELADGERATRSPAIAMARSASKTTAAA